MYTYDEAFKESLKYFNDDELAAKVFIDKYALRDSDDNILEKTPDDMHLRIASELARIEEQKFKNPLSKEQIFKYLEGFKKIVPQGGPMTAIGNPYHLCTTSNCYVLDSPLDSYSAIHYTDTQLTAISKRRGGVGLDISNLRPAGSPTRNSSRTSTGIIPFMERYSNSIREVGQCIFEDQRILTSCGLKKIKNVKIGEMIWTKKGWIQVTNVFNNGIKKLYKLTTKTGYSCITSIDHIYQTFNENGELTETSLKNLNIGDNIVLSIGNGSHHSTYLKFEKFDYENSNNKPLNCKYPQILDEKLAYILGYSYGDGYVFNKKEDIKGLELLCSNDYPKIKQKIKLFCQEIFDYEIKFTKGDGDLEVLSIHNKAIVKFLEHNKLLKQHSSEIIFPEKIENSTINVQFAFLSGYFDADGDVSKKKSYRFRSINRKFLENVQIILSTCGIASKIHVEERTNENWKTIYTLAVVGRIAQQQFASLMKDSYKIQSSKVISKRDCWLTPFKAKTFNIKFNKYNYCPDNSQYLSANTCVLLSKQEDVITNLLQDKIANIEYFGEGNTFDLNLEEEHLFWCEGLYIHNSGRRGALMITISVHHPEILEFIRVKLDPNKVTGANISVRLTDEFLNAVKNDTLYEQRFPVDSKTPQISRMVSAKEIWKEIIKSSWLRAEPGILFWDNILKESPADCYEDFQTVCTNPCCFSLNSNVFIKTDSGSKELKDINSDDLVWLPVLDKFVQQSGFLNIGLHAVYCISFSNNTSLKITKNHKLASFDKADLGEIFRLTKLKDLEIGETIVCDEGNLVTITSIDYVGLEEVGCIDVPNYGYFVVTEDKTKPGVISGNSEIPLCSLDSCRLLAINLYHYVKNAFTSDTRFDYQEFLDDCEVAQRLMDDIIDIELEQITKIIKKIENDPEPDHIKEIELRMWKKVKEKCYNGRRTGVGITGLGDTLAALNIKYGSDKSIEVVKNIYAVLKFGCYKSSINMAKELGAFPAWNPEKEKDNPFLNRFKKEIVQTQWFREDGSYSWIDTINGQDLYEDMQKYGRRNISLLTTAPTGTLSTETQTSSGIEPVFMLSYTRRKKITHEDKHSRVDFVDQSGDKWQEFTVYHHKVLDWMRITGKTDIKESPWWGCCAEDLDWKQRVKLQAAAQKHIDHAISSTINLPEDVSEEKVAEIYEEAWKYGLKGITVYRKNCRTGVLVDKKEEKVIKNDAPKRPKELPCDVHHIGVKGVEYFVIVGKLNNDPYEILAGKGKLSHKIKNGIIKKVKRGHYQAIFDDGSIMDSVTDNCEDNEEALTRMVSTALRHGSSIDFIVQQLSKTKGDMFGFAKSLARALKYYIPKGTTVAGANCPECGNNLIYSEGCSKCVNCSWSKCS